MANFHPIEERCKQCYTCYRECPTSLIAIHETTKYPYAPDVGTCLNCGHCVILCPYEAATLETFPPEDHKKQDLSNLPSFEQVQALLQTRRSARQYENKEVPRETLDQLISIIKYAPTGANYQGVSWIICDNLATRDRVYEHCKDFLKTVPDQGSILSNNKRLVLQEGKDGILRQAPHFIVALTNKDYLVPEDGIISLSYFEVACQSLGLGSVWGGMLTFILRDYQPLREFLGIREDQHICQCHLFGYNKIDRCEKLPPRNEMQIRFV